MKPKVFVGSASETRTIVDALESELRDVAEIDRWDADVFRPGRFTLEALILAVKQVDFAIFVLGRDDVTESRGNIVPSPRDNVIFEAGLFTAILGRERTFYVVDKGGTKIPSDWAGLSYLTFDNAETRPRDKVYEAVSAIRSQLSTWRGNLGPLSGIVGHWWQVIAVEAGVVLSLMEITVADGATLILSGSSWDTDGTMQARYRSLSARYDPASQTLHYSWEGDHPRAQNIPRYYGIGTITFRVDAKRNASGAAGWFSSTSVSDVKDAVAKATTYVRATAEEVEAVHGSDPDKRASVIKAKLRDRTKFDMSP
jgi:hypothetical protein